MSNTTDIRVLTAEERAELKRLAEGATPGPWAYRSQEFDDWGVVRGPLREDGHRAFLARVRAPHVGREQEQAHREAGTDPYEANARYIAAVSPDLTLGALAYVEHLEAQVRELTEALGKHKVEVLDILRDMRLPPLPLPAAYTRGGEVNHAYDYAKGRNVEREAINTYCNQKAYEYDPQGIGPSPTKVGEWDTRPAAGLSPSSQDPAGAGETRLGRDGQLYGPEEGGYA